MRISQLMFAAKAGNVIHVAVVDLFSAPQKIRLTDFGCRDTFRYVLEGKYTLPDDISPNAADLITQLLQVTL